MDACHHDRFPRRRKILDLIPTTISRKKSPKVMLILRQDPRRGSDGREGRRSSKMIYSRETSLGENARISFKQESSTLEAGDPQSKMKSTRVSLGLSFRFAFLAPIVGHSVTAPVRLAIVITINLQVFGTGP